MSLLAGILPLVSTIFAGPLNLVFGIFDALLNSQTGRLVLVGTAALFGGWFWGWSYEHRALGTAITSLNAQWIQKIEAANAEGDRKVQEALNAAKAVPPAPSGDALVRLCRADPACRKVAKK
jgi:hypothetical protein